MMLLIYEAILTVILQQMCSTVLRPQRHPGEQRRVCTVISGGQKKRNGTPQEPVPTEV